MKKKLKKKIFQQYEKDEHFQDNLEKVKANLSFAPKKKSRYPVWAKAMTIAASSIVVIASVSVLSVVFATGPNNSKQEGLSSIDVGRISESIEPGENNYNNIGNDSFESGKDNSVNGGEGQGSETSERIDDIYIDNFHPDSESTSYSFSLYYSKNKNSISVKDTLGFYIENLHVLDDSHECVRDVYYFKLITDSDIHNLTFILKDVDNELFKFDYKLDLTRL